MAELSPKTVIVARRVVDLTYALSDHIPYWPGNDYEPFTYSAINSIACHGVAAGRFAMPEHMGTHLDAPNHFESGAPSIDQLAAESLLCNGVLVDITVKARRNSGALLSEDDVATWHDQNGAFPDRCVVLVRSGWSSRWTDAPRFKNHDAQGRMDFPAISGPAAEMLARDTAVVGVGVDTLSVDNGVSQGSPAHHAIHGAGKFVLENLANLEQLPPRGFALMLGVLPIQGGTGAPARVLALLDAEIE